MKIQSSSLDDRELVIPTMNSEGDTDNILKLLINNIISEVPRYPKSADSSLTAPELRLVNVDTDDFSAQIGGNRLLGSSYIDQLAWLIPAVIVGTIVLIAIAVVCFYGVRALELKVNACCFRICGCCPPRGSRGSGHETDPLTSNAHQTEMKGYRTTMSQSYDPFSFES